MEGSPAGCCVPARSRLARSSACGHPNHLRLAPGRSVTARNTRSVAGGRYRIRSGCGGAPRRAVASRQSNGAHTCRTTEAVEGLAED